MVYHKWNFFTKIKSQPSHDIDFYTNAYEVLKYLIYISIFKPMSRIMAS